MEKEATKYGEYEHIPNLKALRAVIYLKFDSLSYIYFDRSSWFTDVRSICSEKWAEVTKAMNKREAVFELIISGRRIVV